MKFQEPKAVFVKVDLISTTGAPSNCNMETSKRGSVETCTGPDAPYNDYCPADKFMFGPLHG